MTTLQRMRAEKQPRASRNTNWSLHLTAQVSRIRKITCHEEILFHEEPPTAWPFASLGSEPTCALVGKTAQCSACAVAPTAPTATALCPETGARVSLMCGNSSKLLVITPINASSKNKGDGLGVIKAALTLHWHVPRRGLRRSPRDIREEPFSFQTGHGGTASRNLRCSSAVSLSAATPPRWGRW